MNDLTLDDAAHLLRRAGFGGSLEDLEFLVALGREGAIASLVYYENVPDTSGEEANELFGDGLRTERGSLQNWALYRTLRSTRPLQERLTWFWHGHFTSSADVCLYGHMALQNETWRTYAKANFREFLDYWGDADIQLKEIIDARQRLNRLSS